MSRKHCHRKYRAPSAAVIEHTIQRSKAVDPERAVEVMNEVRARYQRMREGNGTDEDFNEVGMVLNIGLILSEKVGNGAPLVAGFNAAIAALEEASARQAIHGRYGFSGPGLLAMNCAMDLYADMLGSHTPMQLGIAAREAIARVLKQMQEAS